MTAPSFVSQLALPRVPYHKAWAAPRGVNWSVRSVTDGSLTVTVEPVNGTATTRPLTARWRNPDGSVLNHWKTLAQPEIHEILTEITGR